MSSLNPSALTSIRPLRPATATPAAVFGALVAFVGFILLATAVATGAPEGIWPSTVFVASAVPLRHSLEEGDTEPQRRPGLLLTSLAMIVAGILMAVL